MESEVLSSYLRPGFRSINWIGGHITRSSWTLIKLAFYCSIRTPRWVEMDATKSANLLTDLHLWCRHKYHSFKMAHSIWGYKPNSRWTERFERQATKIGDTECQSRITRHILLSGSKAFVKTEKNTLDIKTKCSISEHLLNSFKRPNINAICLLWMHFEMITFAKYSML